MSPPSPQDLTHLRRCVELAAEAVAAGDFPFGSVLVAADGRVLAEDRNRENTMGDATTSFGISMSMQVGFNVAREFLLGNLHRQGSGKGDNKR